MPIIKDMTTATGTLVRYHCAVRIEVNAGVRIVVNSWASKEVHDAAGPLAWQDTYGPASIAVLSETDPLAAAEAWLISDYAPMAGGELDVPAEAIDLTLAKARAWTRVKASREDFEFGGFDVDGIGRFDSDASSQQRIMGSVITAQLSGQTSGWSIAWTLADNSVVTLDFAQMVLVGEALAAHVASAHERGRLLRAMIDAAATADDASAITWTSLSAAAA